MSVLLTEQAVPTGGVPEHKWIAIRLITTATAAGLPSIRAFLFKVKYRSMYFYTVRKTVSGIRAAYA
jgi:hypothetical protein